MSCLSFGQPGPSLPAPHASAPVAIPRALLTLEQDPRAALDEIVRISRALPDGRDTARLIDVALDHLVVPRFAQVMPWLNVYGILTEARPPSSSGRFPAWPRQSDHANLLHKHFSSFWSDELSGLVPDRPPPADPDRWMLMSWLEGFTMYDEQLIPLMRAWAGRATREGRRDLAWSLTRSATRRAECLYTQDHSVLAPILAEEANRLESLGWIVDAYRARCRLAQLLGEPTPRPLRIVAPVARDVRDIEQSLLEEASGVLEQALFDETTALADASTVRPWKPVAAPLRRMRELWQAAGTLDPDRLTSDAPQAVLAVLDEDPALAVELAELALGAADERTDVADDLRAMLAALGARARDGASALVLGQHLMTVARGLLDAGRAAAALPVALLARRTALDDIAPWVEAAQRLLSRQLGEIATAAGDAALASEIVHQAD